MGLMTILGTIGSYGGQIVQGAVGDVLGGFIGGQGGAAPGGGQQPAGGGGILSGLGGFFGGGGGSTGGQEQYLLQTFGTGAQNIIRERLKACCVPSWDTVSLTLPLATYGITPQQAVFGCGPQTGPGAFCGGNPGFNPGAGGGFPVGNQTPFAGGGSPNPFGIPGGFGVPGPQGFFPTIPGIGGGIQPQPLGPLLPAVIGRTVPAVLPRLLPAAPGAGGRLAPFLGGTLLGGLAGLPFPSLPNLPFTLGGGSGRRRKTGLRFMSGACCNKKKRCC